MIVKLNIKPIIDELSHIDLKSVIKGVKNESIILRNWNSLIKALKEIAPKIVKGENVGEELIRIGKLAGCLSKSVADLGSLIPGPIGFVCSLALALTCLIPPFDLVGLVMNLMGCIPFAKVGTKALKPLLGNLIKEVLSNPSVKATMKACPNGVSNGLTGMKKFVEKGSFFAVTSKCHSYAETTYKSTYKKLFGASNQITKKNTEMYTSNGTFGGLLMESKIKTGKVETFTTKSMHDAKQTFLKDYHLTGAKLNVGSPFIYVYP